MSHQPKAPGERSIPTHELTPNFLSGLQRLKAKDPEGALTIFSREDPNSPCYGSAMAHAGLLNQQLGNWEAAIADSQKALVDFDRDCPLPQLGVAARRTVADALAASGRPHQSLEHYHVALELAVELSAGFPEFQDQLKREKGIIYVHLAGAYLQVGPAEAALASLQAAREILRTQEDAVRIGLPEALENLAYAYHQSQSPDRAGYALDEALCLPALSEEQRLRLEIAKVQVLHPPTSEARPIIQRGIDEALAKDNLELATMRCGMGLIAALANSDLDWGKELLAIADRLEPDLPSDSLWPARLSFYRAQVLERADADPCDVRKILVAGAQQWCTRSGGRGQLADYQVLAGKMSDHFRKLARHCLDTKSAKEAFVAFEAGRARGIVAEMRNNLTHELTAACPFHPDGRIDLTLLDDIQRRLSPGDVIVALASVPPTTACFVVGANKFEVFEVETPVSIGLELRLLPGRLKERKGVRAIPDQILQMAQKIVGLVGNQTVRAFVPFRSLHLVPWRALLKESGLSWKQLRFGVSFSPTLHVRHKIDLKQCQAIGYGEEQGIDFNDEAQEFAAHFGSNGHFTADATKADFRAALMEPSVVMVSCHGGLSPAPIGQNFSFTLKDGKVGLEEVLPKQPRSPLIIFSACDSGVYEMMDGDYPVGAAPTVVLRGNAYCACTRFPIRADFSRQFFSAFGRMLVAGVLPEDALTDASAELEAGGADLWRDLACVELLIRGD